METEMKNEGTLTQKQQDLIKFQAKQIEELKSKNTLLEIDIKIIQENSDKLLDELRTELKRFKLASEISKTLLENSYKESIKIKEQLKEATLLKQNAKNEIENNLKNLYKATGVQEMLDEKKRHDDFKAKLQVIKDKQKVRKE